MDCSIEFPKEMRAVWEKLIHKGYYISTGTNRELFNEIVRNQDMYNSFFGIFGHRLVVHPRDFVYAEDLKNKTLIKGSKELICFLAVFFERYRKLYPDIHRPWYDEITQTTQNLKDIAVFSTETSSKRLQQVGLIDCKDIYTKVLKGAQRAGLLIYSDVARRAAEENDSYDELRFQFCSPIRRFIDIFNDLASKVEEDITNVQC